MMEHDVDTMILSERINEKFMEWLKEDGTITERLSEISFWLLLAENTENTLMKYVALLITQANNSFAFLQTHGMEIDATELHEAWNDIPTCLRKGIEEQREKRKATAEFAQTA